MAILKTFNLFYLNELNKTLTELRLSAYNRKRRIDRKKSTAFFNESNQSKSLLWLFILLICISLTTVSLFVLIYFNIIDPFNSPLCYEIFYWFEDKIKILISLVIEEDITMPDDFDAEIAKLLRMIDEL